MVRSGFSYSAGLSLVQEQVKKQQNFLFYTLIFLLANNAIMRSYCSTASREDERNTVMTFLSAMRALGFILGPCTTSI